MSNNVVTVDQLIGEIFDADLLTPDAGGELELPGWLRISCPTEGRTAQTSASTVQSGFAASAARAVSRDGSSWALLVEHAITNPINDQSDLDTWTKTNTPVVSSVAAPDGVAGNFDVADDDGAAIEYISEAFTGYDTTANATLSFWSRVTGGAPTTDAIVDLNDGSGLQIAIAAEDGAWTFRSVTDIPSLSSSTITIIPRRITVADTGNFYVWGIQLEVGSYPTSYIGADGVNFARAADVLRAAAEVIAPGGLYHIVLRYRPHYAQSEQATDHNLVYFDASNRLYLRQSDSKLVLVVDGEELASSALTFSRYQELTITIEHSEKQRRLLVAGATTGNSDTTGAAQDAIALPTGWAFILGGPSGAEESSELVGVDFPDLITFADFADSRALVQMGDAVGERNFRDLLQVLAVGAGRYRDVCYAMRDAFDFDTAAGDQLDKIGAIVGLGREGFDDDRYRVFLGIQIELLLSANREDGEWAGTCESILRICRTFAGAAAGTIVLTNYPPLHYVVQVPDLVLSEAELLARFLRTANYAATIGQLLVIISSDSLWESNVSPITDGGVWESNVSPIAGASEWQIVVST